MKSYHAFLIFLFFLLTGCVHSSSDSSEMSAYQQLNLGLAYLAEQKLSMAKNYLLTAQQLAPKNPMVLDALGYYFEQIQDNEKANQYYRLAIQYHPESAAAHNNYGVFLCRTGNDEEGLAQLNDAIRSSDYPQQSLALKNKALCAANTS